MPRRRLAQLAVLLVALSTSVAACRGVATGDGDADADSDVDSDVDGDADADTDGGAQDCSTVPNPCEVEDAARCSADLRAVEVCQVVFEGCLVWVAITECSDHQGCVDLGEMPECLCDHECDAVEATSCTDDVIMTCEGGADGCRILEADDDCADLGRRCDDSSGVATCVEEPSCDDGTCDSDEDPETCPEDCSCDDGVCSPPSEDAESCPEDCPAVCGDGLCTDGESLETCPEDCSCVTSFHCEAETSDFECGVLTADGRRHPDLGLPFCSDVLSRDACSCDLLRCVSPAPLCPGTYTASFRERLISGCNGVPGVLHGTCIALWNVVEQWPAATLIEERALYNVSMVFGWDIYDHTFTLTAPTTVRLVVEQDAWLEDVSGVGNAGRAEVDWAEVGPAP